MSGKRKARDRDRQKAGRPQNSQVSPDAGAGGGNRTFIMLVIVAVLVAFALTIESPFGTSTDGSASDQSVIPNPETAQMESQVAAAIAQAREAVLKNPESSIAWGEYAFVLDAHGLLEYAEPAYKRAIALDPGNLLYTYNYAVLLTTVGRDLKHALKLFREFIVTNPKYAAVHVRIGTIQEMQGEIGKAAKSYHRAIELDPSFALAHRSLGQARLLLDNCPGAVVALERAVSLAPLDSISLGALAQAYSCSGDEARAMAASKKLSGMEIVMPYPDTIRLRAMSFGVGRVAGLGRANRLKVEGDYAGALRELKALEKARPNSASTQDLLSEVYRLLGDEATARKHSDRANLLRENRAKVEQQAHSK